MSDSLQLIICLAYLLVLLGLAWWLYKKPPKKINDLYGYRTARSKKNQDTWQEANRYSSVFMLKLSLYSFVLPFIGYLFYPQLNVLVTLVAHSLLLLLIIVFTERHLREVFDKEGNRK